MVEIETPNHINLVSFGGGLSPFLTWYSYNPFNSDLLDQFRRRPRQDYKEYYAMDAVNNCSSCIDMAREAIEDGDFALARRELAELEIRLQGLRERVKKLRS